MQCLEKSVITVLYFSTATRTILPSQVLVIGNSWFSITNWKYKMRLRNLHFPSRTSESLCKILALSGFPATINGDDVAVTNWLQTSSFLETASDAFSKFSPAALAALPAGYLWTVLPESNWVEFCAIVDCFTWEEQEEGEIHNAENFARRVLRGDGSIDESVGDPVLFIAAIRWDYGEQGRMAAALASAFSVLSTIVRCGGDFIWRRFAFDEKLKIRKLKVTWSDGKYRLGTGWWQTKNASRRASSHLSEARVLKSTMDRNENDDSQEEDTVSETKHVASAAMWLGVPVRLVTLHVLRDLLKTSGRPIIEYVETEGVNLADILVLGGETALHSRQGKVVLFSGHVLQYPSLEESDVSGYFFKCEWGLTRAEIHSSRRKDSYNYLRVHNEQDERNWAITDHETYTSRRTKWRKLRSLCEYALFTTQVQLMRRKHAQVNANDAKAELQGKGVFVLTAEETTTKPMVTKVMLKALSDRIPLHLSWDDVEESWKKCFGANEQPGGNDIQDDEQVLVLSYRHESIDVRMSLSNWRYCYEDLAEVAEAHGKKAMRVWTDKLASNSRGDARWIESGVDPYRNAVVVAFNGPGDSIFVDRFWLSLERNTGLRAWGYWLRDDIGQLVRMGRNPYPARTADRAFLSQILFTPGRADGPLWEEDRLAVIREAADLLGIRDLDSLWEALTWEFLPTRYSPFDVVNQDRQCGRRQMRGVGWSPAADVLVDRELIERALGFTFKERTSFKVKKWVSDIVDGGNRFVGIKSLVSDDWFCAVVRVSDVDGELRVEDVFERNVVSTARLEEYTADLNDCSGEHWI